MKSHAVTNLNNNIVTYRIFELFLKNDLLGR